MTPPRQHPPLTAFLVAVLGIALFSGMDAVMKGLVIAIGTVATMFWRNLIGIGMSGALYLAQPSPWPSQPTMRLHLARGLLSTVMGFLFFWGLARVPLAQAIALAFIAPLIALYLAAVLLKETVGGRTVGASLIAFAGVLVIFVGQAQADLGREATIGSLAILSSAVCYALNIILMRRQAQVAGPVEIAFFQSVIVTVVLAAFIPLLGVAVPAAVHWPLLIFAASLAIASHMLLSWAYARAEANYLAATEFTSFLWAALFGWLIFREALSPYTLAGAALIVAGCILAARRPADVSPRLEAAT
ncbi:DMT family transporter [Sphingomonas sp.]|uniref:DMT family transporter n=1 Tax=Sphingomonas sp. TaxID=28214 RepID=UPI001850EB07|nr:DMT family transporter [Sphingomonas sp.]MBA3512169.1 DMT family transporter [Sphingomonas sp.]